MERLLCKMGAASGRHHSTDADVQLGRGDFRMG